jgi:mono/diheme cytochrome c family protein
MQINHGRWSSARVPHAVDEPTEEKRITMIRIFVATAALLSLQMHGTLAADAAQGEQLAQRWCASCHAVTADARQATDIPPPFTAIAQRPDFNAARLAYFLLNPHPIMPNMGLSRTEATDLAAYIASLRK